VVELLLDAEAYSADAIQRAAYLYSDRLSLELAREGPNYRCRLTPIGEQDPELVEQFKVELLDSVLRERIRGETEAVRNVVLALAFSHTGLTDAVDA
jgi:His-Xaa-Ser system protein HxsD